jgi:hypothetical protein
MTLQVVPATGILISLEYSPDGVSWVVLHDHHLIGWHVDYNSTIPNPPLPSVAGALPFPPIDTSPISSPPFAIFENPPVIVPRTVVASGAPDLWRGTFPDFLTWLATNNGAKRLIGARIACDPDLLNGTNTWAQQNPDRVYNG